MDPLHAFFHPDGVAVIGASSNPNKLSYGVLHNLATHGYDGPIYPVNPKGGEILGLKVYRSLPDLPDPVELAVIILPPELSIETLKACGERGIQAVVVVASGFSELGASGEEREAELGKIIERYDMRLIGPNCIGVLDTTSRVDTTFLTNMPEPGSIGLASHSGAICGGTVDWANTVALGFSRIISLGNQVDVNMADALASLAADPQTRVVAAYIEGLPNGQEFVRVGSELTREKPLVVIKAGRTPSGTRAVASHTGALAGESQAFQAACHRAGAIDVEDLQGFVDASLALAYRRPLSGTGIALLTNAGGPGAVAADALDRQGLHLVDLCSDTRECLREACPPGTMTNNPIDMLGGAEPGHFRAALDILSAAPEVDGILVAFVPQALTGPREIAEAVGQAARDITQPVVCCIYGGRGIRRAASVLHRHAVPHYLTPARAALGLGALRRYHLIQTETRPEPRLPAGIDQKEARAVLRRAGARRVLDAHAGGQLAAAYGLRVPSASLVATDDEAAKVADRLGYPVALKRVAPEVVHKSDVGGVALRLEDEQAVRDAFNRIVEAEEQALIQRMAPDGPEVIVGAQRDRQFGPLVMFGLGGVYVEVLEDVAFRLAPLTKTDARDMVGETAAGKLLKGVRGQPPADTEAVVDALCRVGWLMADFPEVSEVDLNPLIVGREGEGAWAVDVRVVLGETL